MVKRIPPALFAVIMVTLGANSLSQQPPTEQRKPSQNPEVLAQQIAHPQPITEDLSHGASFKFKIAPDLPEFTFKVIPEPQDPDEYGNPHTTVREVQVFRGDSKEPMQSLEGCEFSDMEAPPKSSDWFRAEDINFDGYSDIFVMTMWGATGNQFGCVWLYDPESGRFEFSKDFSELGGFVLDRATKTITTHGNGGMAGTVFRATKYVVENDRPVPVITVAQDFDFASKKYDCLVQQRRGRENALVTVRDAWAESKGDFEGPCDPSDPFRGVEDK